MGFFFIFPKTSVQFQFYISAPRLQPALPQARLALLILYQLCVYHVCILYQVTSDTDIYRFMIILL